MSIEKKNLYVPLPLPTRGFSFPLRGDPKGKTIIYPSKNSIVVRDIENPMNAYMYTEHSVNTTVAAYSPSGFYIASADSSGKVRIWDTTQEEHILKYEYRPLSGSIKDIAWTEDSKRIAVCGEGSDVFARAFLWDSGSSIGEIGGHAKSINSVDIRQQRPFRLVTASEDTNSGFYPGPPFKQDHFNKEHTRFVNVVRYAPDGHCYVTGGADGKLFVYEGKEGTLLHELNGGAENGHDGQVFALSWSSDNKRMLTSSGDRTVKMWDVDENKLLVTFTFGEAVEDQQVACLWQGDYLLSVSLSGSINYLDIDNPSKPTRVLEGLNKSIDTMALDADVFYTGSVDGRVARTSAQTGETTLYQGSPEGVAIKSASVSGGNLVVATQEDCVRVTPKDAASLSEELIKLESNPQFVASAGGVSVVACYNHVGVVAGNKAENLPINYEALCIAINSAANEVAVGGKDKKIHIYSLSGSALSEKAAIDASGEVICLGYSPDGRYLASGDSNRNLYVFDAASHELLRNRWKFHSAKVTCLAWTPNSQCIATGGLDTNIFIWNMENPNKRIQQKGAHPMACVTAVHWASDTELYSAGLDGSVRSWTVTHL